nr:hypothetical protein [Deltaproteobacteria bacterium]
MRILAVAPRHLGDGVMALPALAALARVGDLVIRAPAWGATLYRDVPATLDSAEVDGAGADADVAVVF